MTSLLSRLKFKGFEVILIALKAFAAIYPEAVLNFKWMKMI
jgi:hypothetical protein